MMRPSKPAARLFATLACALVLAMPLAAQTQVALGGLNVDRSAPVEVTADNLRVEQSTRSAVFEGNVVIGQGAMRIAAARVEVAYGADSSQIARLVASGGVTFVTETEEAEAQEAVYDVENGRLTLSGDVLLSQGGNALSAESMEIDLASGAATMAGRVTTVFGAAN